MWAFTATIYTYTIPFLLIVALVGKDNSKTVAWRLMAASNPVLIFYSFWLIGFYYEVMTWFFKWPGLSTGLEFKNELDVEGLVVNMLKILLPFVFLFKQYALNKWLTFFMWVLLNYYSITGFAKQYVYFFNDFYLPYAWFSKIAFYCSGLVFFYSLFWIVKKKHFNNAAKR